MGLLKFLTKTSHKVNHEAAIDAAIRSYLALKAPATAKQYAKIIAEFTFYLSGLPLNLATESEAAGYAQMLAARRGVTTRGMTTPEPLAASTVLRKCVVLKGLYRVMLRSRLVDLNPFDFICECLKSARTGTKRPTEALTPKQVRRLLEAPGTDREGVRDRALLALLFGGGLRISDALALNLEDVQSDDSTLYLRLKHTKAQKQEEQVIPDWVERHLLELVIQRGETDRAVATDPLFVTYRATEIGGRLQQRNARTRFKKLLFAAGLPNSFSTHSGRATAATQLLSSGADYGEVKQFLRHSSFAMVERYDKRRKARADHPAKKLSYFK